MILGFVIIIAGMLGLMFLERLYPDQKLKTVRDWWPWVVIINIVQLIIVLVGINTWEKWLLMPGIFNLAAYVGPVSGGFIAYFFSTWVFYWWHYLRHEYYPLWVLFHQMHHSPQRIETATSFYKHPIEIFADSVLMTIILYPILGLTPDSSIWLSGLCAFGEFFYHMNIKTPIAVGYFIQRPESHRYHHRQNKQTGCVNFSDMPIFDMLNNTFKNALNPGIQTGFDKNDEQHRLAMLMFRDVKNPYRLTKKNCRKILYSICCLFIVAIGCANIIGFVINSDSIKGFAVATASSPLPLVFTSFNGVETFSLDYMIKINQANPIPLTKQIYSQIDGPYNRRNVYGAMFAYSPFFQMPELIKLRDQILSYVVCNNVIKIDSVTEPINTVNVIVRSKTLGFEQAVWMMNVTCK